MDILDLEMKLDCDQFQVPAVRQKKKRENTSNGAHFFRNLNRKTSKTLSSKMSSLSTEQATSKGENHIPELPSDFGALVEKSERVEEIGTGSGYDITRTPAPYCSCTGNNQQCYRWGNGGWQSACCTNLISMHPLPMNPKKTGSRLAGRKMSAGAFQKLLTRLVLEGWDVSYPVDLKDHWAKHGTNRYVTRK